MGIKRTLEEIQERVKLENKHGDRIIITGEHNEIRGIKVKRNKRIIECFCTVCSTEWSVECGSLLDDKNGCSKCSKKYRMSLEEIKEALETFDYRLLDDKFISKLKHINVIDKDGYKYKTTFNSISQERKLFRFGKNNPYTIENMHNYIELSDSEYDLISTEWVDSFDKLDFYCHIHEDTFPMTWNNFYSNNRGCPICRGGYYSPKVAEYYKDEWSKKKAVVYIIECSSDETKEKFIKIGITTRTIDERFKYYMPYDYRAIRIIDEISLYDACYIGHELHNLNRKHRHICEIDFAGKSECFSKLEEYDYDKRVRN